MNITNLETSTGYNRDIWWIYLSDVVSYYNNEWIWNEKLDSTERYACIDIAALILGGMRIYFQR